MKRIMWTLFCFLLSSPGYAQIATLQGDFTHDFTRPKNKSVWIVTKSGNAWDVRLGSDKKSFAAKEVADVDRTVFWKKMLWPAEAAIKASCISFIVDPDVGESIICHVPPSVRDIVDNLKTFKSDFFYFDPVGGLNEIRKKSR